MIQRKFFYIGLLLLCNVGVSAQSGFSTLGGDCVSDKGAQQSFSVGQIATETFSSEEAQVLLGIQQDYLEHKAVISSNEIPSISGTLDTVFSEINLSDVFFTEHPENLTYSASSSDESVVRVVLADDRLSIVLYGTGTATITVTATDKGGVSETTSFEVDIEKNSPSVICNLNIQGVVTHVLCAGEETGEIVVFASYGVKPYRYLWSNGRTDNGVYSVVAGEYSVVVTDSVGCSATRTFVVTEPNPISISEAIVQPECSGANGEISVSISGGTKPYTYKWDDGDSKSQTKKKLSSGIYTIEVTDSKKCTMQKSIALNENGAPEITFDTIVMSKCGVPTGEVKTKVHGGNGTYTCMWSDGSVQNNRDKLKHGKYTLTVVDEKQCKSVAVAEVKTVPIRQPEIALVTVGQESGKNLVVWQKEDNDEIDHYTIWREGEKSGQYDKIGDVPFHETSIFPDGEANINEQSWRYRITATDQCGNESPMGHEHKTIHLQKSRGFDGEVNLVWDNYEGIEYATYCLYRQTPNGMELFKKVPASLNRYTDLNPPKDVKGYYAAVLLNDTIDVTKPMKSESGPFVMAISNIAEVENVDNPDAVEMISGTYNISVIDKTIYVTNVPNGSGVSVYDIAGQCVFSGAMQSNVAVSVKTVGTYVVKVGDERQTVVIK